jgi:hypothetical protein
MDLGRYLKRKFISAPSVSNQGVTVTDMDEETFELGGFPRMLIEEEQARIDRALRDASDLSNMKSVVNNAAKKVKATVKVKISGEAHNLAKEWISSGKHLLAHSAFSANNSDVAVHQIAKFKPSETIFEVVRRNCGTERQEENRVHALGVIAAQRKHCEKVKGKPVAERKSKSSLVPGLGKYRDPLFYLDEGEEKYDQATEKGLEVFQEMSKAALDYGPDEDQRKNKNKRYGENGENKGEMMMMKSFEKKATGDAYNKWKKKRSISLPSKGEKELGKQELSWIQKAKGTDYRYRNGKGRRDVEGKNSGRFRGGRDEVRRPEQVLKKRKQEYKRKHK